MASFAIFARLAAKLNAKLQSFESHETLDCFEGIQARMNHAKLSMGRGLRL